MLCGEHPFDGEDVPGLNKSIKKGKLTFKEKQWKKISKEAKDFIRDCCMVNPDERLSAGDLLTSDWIQKFARKPAEKPAELKEALTNIQRFSAASKF